MYRELGIRIVNIANQWTCPAIPSLSGELDNLLAQIPAGRVTTFGDLAESLGDLSAARWVAQELATRSAEPWHRVVKRTGELVHTRPERLAIQRNCLFAEGISVDSSNRIDLPSARFREFSTEAPLHRLAKWQADVALWADGNTHVAVPAVIGGLDVSYVSENEAVAAYVEVDVTTGATLFSAVHKAKIGFPYVTGYLTFRELPIHLALIEQVRRSKPLAKAILVDGAGQLHPRRSGIAVAVGVVANCVTIGVAKHHLCGGAVSRDKEPLLELNGAVLGQALVGRTSHKPLQISPGHGMSLTSAVACVRAVWQQGRLPIPIREADALSRRAAKTVAD